MIEVVLVSGARTAVGRFGGGFKDTPAADLGAAAIQAAIERAGIAADAVDHVVMGCVGQVAEDAYLSRAAAIQAGVPMTTPAVTVNRLCGSGLEAINTAARLIETGDAEVVVAGGAENMSRLPYYSRATRFGARMGDVTLEDGITLLLSDPFNRYHMGVTAENLAAQFELDRPAMDAFATESHRRATDAIAEGRFREQIVPVTVPDGRGTKVIDTDEHPRSDATLEGMAKLRPAFKADGCVTAGNASGINDGAAAVVLMSAAKARTLGVTPRLRMIGRAEAGVDPALMGSGPIPATRRVLEKTGMTLDQLDVIELNEAFASVALACSSALGLDPGRTNPNGGAVALGHPVGATGAILTVKLLYELERSQGQFGLVTLCIGGGQGIATIFERR
jgi:acetyl-CoA C-acetyltransferase